MPRELGSVEPGKLADLVILDRDPTADLRHTTSVSRVMKNGRLYDAMTLAEQWPRPRPGPTVRGAPETPTPKAGLPAAASASR